MVTEAPTPAVETAIVLLPVTDLETLNATEANLKQMRDRALSYATITGIPDKDAYTEVHKFIQVAVKVRTSVTALAESLAEPHKAKAKAILDEGKRIGEHARETERIVRPLKEAYETEQERLRDEQKRNEATKLQNRTQAVINLGMIYTGSGYQIDDVVIDNVDLKAMPDQAFDELLSLARVAFENKQAEQRRQEEERRQEAERLENQRQEQQAEAKRQQAITAENNRIAADLKRQQDDLVQQQRTIRQELISSRATRLKSAGFLFTAGYYFHPGKDTRSWTPDQIADLPTEELEVIIADGIQLTAEAVAAQIKQDADDAEAARLLQIKQDNDAKAALKKKQQEDSARVKRLAPDKKLIGIYFNKVVTHSFLATKEQESADLLQAFGADLDRLVGTYRAKLESL